MTEALVLGAVAYDAKVVTIWDGFRELFARNALSMDYVLFTNYERMVEAHFRGELHVAWNSPLAWVESCKLAARRGRKARAVAMRDSDMDLTSVVLVKSDSDIQGLDGLTRKRIGVGARDSPQATLIPLLHLAQAGVHDHTVVEHNIRVGQHGDHVGGERDAVRALLRGDVDAACIIDSNSLAFAKDGTLPPGSTRVVAQTRPYDHCNFTVLDDAPLTLIERFTAILLAMRYDDAGVRALMDLEGLKAWKPGRTSGYEQLIAAVDRFHSVDAWLERQG